MGVGMSHLPQSLSPMLRALATPPGHARMGPLGWPSAFVARPSCPPAATTRFLSSAESLSRVFGVSWVSSGDMLRAFGRVIIMAHESPVLQHVSSPRVSLTTHSVAVVPAVVFASLSILS